MDNNETSWPLSNNSGNISSRLDGFSPMYVFTPVNDTAKVLLCSILSSIAGLGFLGNCLLLFFLWKKPKTNPIQSSRFMQNLNLYVRSMSLSDILSCVVSLPLLCIQISSDVFQSGWACRVVRYFNFVFPAITINTLVVISLEKYLSTRDTPRTFSASTVRRMIIFAWVFGSLFVLLPVAAYDGIRVDLNDTHFTVICRYDDNFYPFRMALIVFPLQYILPGVFIAYINICLMKTVWVRGRQRVGVAVNNAFRANMIAARIKGISLLIAITFSFIVTYFFFLCNTAYTTIAKPERDFSTDFIMRYATGAIVYLNCVINVIIYFIQMSDFRKFLKELLKKLLCRSGDASSQVSGLHLENPAPARGEAVSGLPQEKPAPAVAPVAMTTRVEAGFIEQPRELTALKPLSPTLIMVDNVQESSEL